MLAAVQDGMPGQLPMYKGTLDAVKTIVRTEGWRGLYAGLTPSIIGSSELLLAVTAAARKRSTSVICSTALGRLHQDNNTVQQP